MNREDYFKYYIQGSDHYLMPKDVFDELFEEMENWKEEAKELKKQLGNKYSRTGTLTNEVLYEENTKLINQQKEFIEWLETMNRMYQNEYKDIDTAEHYNCVLQKYKEIIGVSNENNMGK